MCPTRYRAAELGTSAAVWAMIGSGERPTRNPDADWIATVQTLLADGVAAVLRAYGVPDDDTENQA